MMVLSRTESCCGTQLCGTSSYGYEDAVIHRQGLGFMGFSKVRSVDSRGNLTVRTFDPYNHGVLKSVESPSSETYNTYSIEVKPNKVKKILLDKKTENNLLTGYSTDYSYTYDPYGYPLTETAAYSDGITVKTELSYGDSPETDGVYSLGFVTDRTVTTTRDGDTYTERTHFPEYASRQPLTAVRYVNGNKVERIDYTYDSHGNVTEETVTPYDSPNSLTSEYSYTETGRLAMETDPWGLTKAYAYDSSGRVTGITDYTGATVITYDSFGRETSREYPDGTKSIVSHEWVNDGAPGIYEVSTEETGRPVVFESFDALGRVVRQADVRFASLRKVDMEYNLHGDLARKCEPYTWHAPAGWTTYEYDTYGRLLTVSEPSGRETRRSYSDASVTTWEDGVAVTRTYDSQGNFISSSDSAGPVRLYLAADGRPTVAESLGGINIWLYYDKYRRRSSIGDSGFGSVRYEYDSWGNVSLRVCEGKETAYEYDALNRLKRVTTPELTTSYAYDGYSRLTRIYSDNGTSRTLTYDKYGRTVSCRDTGVDGMWLLREYKYSGGNVSSVRYTAQSGLDLTEEYKYTNGKFREGVCRELSVFRIVDEWDDGSPYWSVTGPISRKHHYSMGIPTGDIAWCGGQEIQDVTYNIDPATRCLDRRWDGFRRRTEEFSYDSLNRLISDGTEEFSYDILGNLTDRSGVGAFEYGIPNKPHAVTGIVPTGDNVPLRTQEISYTSFSRPQSIREGGIYRLLHIQRGLRPREDDREEWRAARARPPLPRGLLRTRRKGLADPREAVPLRGLLRRAGGVCPRERRGEDTLHTARLSRERHPCREREGRPRAGDIIQRVGHAPRPGDARAEG